MGNPYAGEVTLVIDGRAHVMRLTLGALAELEESLGAGSLMALIQRFEDARFSTRDVLALIVAGLRGGGWQGRTADLLQANIEGGPVAASRAAARLLTLAFALPEGAE
ncbi:MAG: gene transfer agent family protein [Pseudomonadota bacterium]|nr:gene transfer agent family protein [Pseudomonadota bacterium]